MHRSWLQPTHYVIDSHMVLLWQYWTEYELL
jgi:hypothetical protein